MARRNHRGNDEHANEHKREHKSEHSYERPVSVFSVALFYWHESVSPDNLQSASEAKAKTETFTQNEERGISQEATESTEASLCFPRELL